VRAANAPRRASGSTPSEDWCMDVNYINPFIEAVDNVFSTMLSVRPKRAGVRVSANQNNTPSITSLVGMSGQVSGVVALRFPPETALKLAGRMLGSEMGAVNGEVVDAVSELVNMVAGSAKAKLHHEPPLQLGLPTVVEGNGYKLKYPSKSVWLEVSFTSDAGPFSMEVTYHPN
jgi:chemotaxis protein CheX